MKPETWTALGAALRLFATACDGEAGTTPVAAPTPTPAPTPAPTPDPAQDFTLSIVGGLNWTANDRVQLTAQVSAIGGFADLVALTVDSPLGGSITPNTVQGSGSAAISISTSKSQPAGTYPVTLTGTTAAGLKHTATVTVNLAANPG